MLSPKQISIMPFLFGFRRRSILRAMLVAKNKAGCSGAFERWDKPIMMRKIGAACEGSKPNSSANS